MHPFDPMCRPSAILLHRGCFDLASSNHRPRVHAVAANADQIHYNHKDIDRYDDRKTDPVQDATGPRYDFDHHC